MATILTSTGIQFPDGTSQAGPAIISSSNYPILRMYYNGGSPWTSTIIPDSSYYKFPLNTASTDTDGGARTSYPNYDYVIPKTGYYLISVDYTLEHSGYLRYTNIYYGKNGSYVIGTQSGAVGDYSDSGMFLRYSAKFSDIIAANVGDVIDAYVYSEGVLGSSSILYCNLQLNYLRPLTT